MLPWPYCAVCGNDCDIGTIGKGVSDAVGWMVVHLDCDDVAGRADQFRLKRGLVACTGPDVKDVIARLGVERCQQPGI